MSDKNEQRTALWEEWRYEFEAWMPTLMSAPVELVISKDHSKPYEVDRKHIFRLESGQFAFIQESGCSCYVPREAKIELVGNKTQAKKLWNAAIEAEYSDAWKTERLP